MAKLPKRFTKKIAFSDKCWVWKASINNGYGQYWHEGRLEKAHRVSWMLHNGPIPEGMLVCHKCDNPPCVRPDHLFLGTYKDNMMDAARKGRLHTKLTAEQVKEIRWLLDQPDRPSRHEIAGLYGVSGTLVRYIRDRVWWQHV